MTNPNYVSAPYEVAYCFYAYIHPALWARLSRKRRRKLLRQTRRAAHKQFSYTPQGPLHFNKDDYQT